jgi:hypothetical protein
LKCAECSTQDDGKAPHYHYLLPSFLHLINELNGAYATIDFRIILRTYGFDAPNVLSALQFVVDGVHPDYAPMRNIRVGEKYKICKIFL